MPREYRHLSDSFDELISWAELYEEASFEKKKMIANCLIKRVDVFRGYKLKLSLILTLSSLRMDWIK